MKDEVVIVDANFDQMTGPRGANDDNISVEIMDRHRIAQSMKAIQRAVVRGARGVAWRSARSSGNPRDRHLTREIAG